MKRIGNAVNEIKHEENPRQLSRTGDPLRVQAGAEPKSAEDEETRGGEEERLKLDKKTRGDVGKPPTSEGEKAKSTQQPALRQCPPRSFRTELTLVLIADVYTILYRT